MNSLMIQALADQAGAPSHPILFLVLGVATLALHLAAVGVMLGSLILAILAALRPEPRWRDFSRTMGYTCKVAVSMAILLGIAPLLFVQVIYDPFWYTANVLSANWLLYFLAFLIIGYLSLYGWNYFEYHSRCPRARSIGLVLLVVALILFLHAGLVMHSLGQQAVLPGSWLDWYAPDGVLDPSGSRLRAILWPRFLFFLSVGLAATGAWLFAARDYSAGRPGADPAAVALIDAVAGRTALTGAALATVFALWWALATPEPLDTGASRVGLILLALGLVLIWAVPCLARRVRCPGAGYLAFAAAALAAILICAYREVARFAALLEQVSWDPLAYKISLDWPSTVVFFLTFLVLGGVTLAYLLTVAWRALRAEGVYTPGPLVNAIGRTAIALLSLWIVIYFAVSLARL